MFGWNGPTFIGNWFTIWASFFGSTGDVESAGGIHNRLEHSRASRS